MFNFHLPLASQKGRQLAARRKRGELFTRHLVSVEVVGTLLLVALVGAIAIVAQARQQREQQTERTDEAGGSADA